MADRFCNYLKNQLRFEYDKVSPCCWYKQKSDIENIKFYREHLLSINDWIPECKYCQTLENTGIKSPRQNSIEKPEVHGLSNDSENITSIDIQIDAECNAACLMCGPDNSTTWKKQQLPLDVPKSKISKIFDSNAKGVTARRLRAVFETVDFSKIRNVIFLGGEPFKSTMHLKVLNQFTNFEDVSVRYVTNGSIRPSQEVIDIFSKLKKIQIYFSIDGIEKHFEYLRWPLNWKQVESNIKFFDDIDLPNKELGFSHAITPFNIFYFDRYLDWAKQTFKDLRLKRGFLHPFKSTGKINTSCIPPRLAEAVEKKYIGSAYKPYNAESISSFIDTFDLNSYINFMKYINFEDKKRNLNWKEVFPEIVEYFDIDYK